MFYIVAMLRKSLRRLTMAHFILRNERCDCYNTIPTLVQSKELNTKTRRKKSSKEAFEKRNAKGSSIVFGEIYRGTMGRSFAQSKNSSTQQLISHLEQHFLFSSPALTLHRRQQKHQESAIVLISSVLIRTKTL